MFESSLVESAHLHNSRKSGAALASLLLQAGVLAVAVLLPLSQLPRLPRLTDSLRLLAPQPAPPPPAAPAPRRLATATPVATLAPPVWLPPQPAAAISPASLAPAVLAPGGGPLPLVLGVPARVLPPPPGPPAAVAKPAPPPPPVTVGGNIQAARCLACPPPSYPAVARSLGLEGTVVFHALIARDGSVMQLQSTAGNALLVAAAATVVRTWRFRPLLLNGQPVVVATVITVHFTLGGG